MAWDVIARRFVTLMTSILTGLFILDVALGLTGDANEYLTDIGSRLIIGALITIAWIGVAFLRRHAEWFSDYYQ